MTAKTHHAGRHAAVRHRSRRMSIVLAITAVAAGALALTTATTTNSPAQAAATCGGLQAQLNACPKSATVVTASPTASPSPSSTSTTPPVIYTCGGETPAAKPDGTAWSCAYNDEFNGTSLDTSQWVAQTTSNSDYTTGLAPYRACYVNDPSTVSVSGGNLNLSVVKLATKMTCKELLGSFPTNYIAGSVSTYYGFDQTYGRYEVNAQLPAATVKGLQETFWLWPKNDTLYGKEPKSGEIDYSEFYSVYAGNDMPYIHYDATTKKDWTNDTNVVAAYPAPNNEPGKSCTFDQSAFNDYVLTWAPNLLTISVNGQTCLVDNYTSTSGGAAPFDQPFFLALTQAMGIGANAPTAATPMGTTKVNFIRVWK